MQTLNMSFEEASARADQLWDEVRRCGSILNGFPKGAMGLTPDSVKFSPQRQAAKAAYDKAHRELQIFNDWYTKTFQKEIVQARRARYSQQAATA